ncbi:MAG: hypothetical protein H0W08_04310 [Acidobacteria bacterium]|nr:hypothetical protein [Acidobacteriota bacterium]
MISPDRSRIGVAQLCALIALMLLVPFGLRALNARFAGASLPASYLPALEGLRQRGPFEREPIEQLAALKPAYVVIGDSMAGTRMHTTRLAELTGRPAAPILQAGSGSAYWYLALKNWVIASGTRPRVVFIFFRDTNLTDVMFRLDEGFRWNIDRVARDEELEVNAAIAARAGALRQRVRTGFDRAYAADAARLWLLPALPDHLARAVVPSRRRRTGFIRDMNARFDFLHMRPFEAADLAEAVDREADFDRYVDRSVLPLMLRDAQAAGITLCFVRVQRRPIGNRPPEQSRALRNYIGALRAYIESRGGIFHDDTGDPNLPFEMYEDGDHVNEAWRPRYTENLYQRLRARIQ